MICHGLIFLTKWCDTYYELAEKSPYPIPRSARPLRWFNSIGGNIDHNLSIFFAAAAVREDSEQHNAHHGKAWHQLRAPDWATKS